MFDIITIGSATIDVFIKTEEKIKKHKNNKNICYHLGEKELIDKIYFSTGGFGTNTAVALSKLGLRTGFIGVIGTDINGETILKELYEEGVEFLGVVREGNSGYSIILMGDNDRTILSYKGVNNLLDLRCINLTKIKTNWLFLGTMLNRSFNTIKEIARFGKENKIKIAANISLYLAEYGVKKLSSYLKCLDIIILNKEELFALTNKRDIKESFYMLKKYSKGIFVVTDGANPCYAFDGAKVHKKVVKKIKPIDMTGAGDAFASGFIYGIIKNRSIETCLDYGCLEASAVINKIGAKNGLLSELR